MDNAQILPSPTYFVSAQLRDHAAPLLTDQVALLRDVVRLAQKQMPFDIDAAVVLPTSVHMLWTLTDPGFDAAARLDMVMTTFERHSGAGGGGSPLWGDAPTLAPIHDPAQLEAHRLWIATAPVRGGLVAQVEDWPFSSVHCVANALVERARLRRDRNVIALAS